ncbi:MAG: dTMP kinase [Thermoleophilia bacterium]|nr:dTMP kinase [Thermoleophilia bacterium]
MKGILITFEGLDGSGKSTQMEMLAEALRQRGYVVLVTREPGGTALGEAVRDILLDPRHRGMSARAEALLYAAARAELVEEVIRPALADGQIVLCDRYLDSSLAYQGFGRGLGTDDIITLNAWATECLFPDLTIFLDLDDSIRAPRVSAVPDRLEAEDEEFHRRVAAGYRVLLRDHPHRIRRVDASGTPEEVQQRVQAVVEEELELFSH